VGSKVALAARSANTEPVGGLALAKTGCALPSAVNEVEM
jgi:hypothetical protein